jgi:hypothetical protein
MEPMARPTYYAPELVSARFGSCSTTPPNTRRSGPHINCSPTIPVRFRRGTSPKGVASYAWGSEHSSSQSQSCRTTLISELLIFSGCSAVYSMNPSLLNLFRKKFTRERVVPIMSASVACEIVGITPAGGSSFP